MLVPRWVLEFRCYETVVSQPGSNFHLGFCKLSYLAQAVLVCKFTLAFLAVVLVVSLGPHVILCSLLCVEFGRAHLTRNFREPVALRVHMVVGGVLRIEGASASFAFEGRCPVIYGVHMLIASGLGAEGSIACFTLNPVTIVIHVLIAVFLPPEFFVTGAAFEHGGRG